MTDRMSTLVQWPTVADRGPMARVLLPDGSYAEWSPEDWERLMQDAKDGAALYRLRQALAERSDDWCWSVEGDWTAGTVVVEAWIDIVGRRSWVATGRGSTVAEAVDECLEAGSYD